MNGLELMEAQLLELGFTTFRPKEGFVSFIYTVPHGRFKGQEITLSFTQPRYPEMPPTGPYVKPHLMQISGGGGSHPSGGIHQRNQPNSDYQYWSRPFPQADWVKSDKHMRSYMAHINRLFDFE